METSYKINESKLSFPYELPKLGYAYDSLEPFIDSLTMEIHHSRHHKTYIDNLNKAVAENAMGRVPLLDLLKNISKHPVVVRNNGGGHFNHSFFWQTLGHSSDSQPTGMLAGAIQEQFGEFEKFKTQFADVAKARFGSGWAWLSLSDKNELFLSSTPNQDNPIMDVAEQRGIPILGLDVWEHAYYLKYMNKRPDYIDAFWNVVNWTEVQKRYEKLVKR
jgi:Fe-Mn family superoxide dismutase